MTALALKTSPMMVQLVERVIESRELNRRKYESVMRHAPHNGGRGQVDHAPSSVNATQTRAARRWTSTSRARLVELFGKEWNACYSIAADGTRTLVTVERTSNRRDVKRSEARRDNAADYRLRLATFGAIGNTD